MKCNIAVTVVFNICICFFSIASLAQEKKAYNIFDENGHVVTFSQMISALGDRQVVLFGEMHNCPVTHWLELQVSKELYKMYGKKLLLGAEMFESDNQLILDEFMRNEISQSSFEKEMRLWNNYSTDYAPLTEFAKENNIPFIATNVPRRYAQAVSRKGLAFIDSLGSEAKSYMAPLPIPSVKDTGRHSVRRKMSEMLGHGTANIEFMVQAQALKDAVMAWRITKYLGRTNDCLLHFNGSFHSDYRAGIVSFLKKYNSSLNIATISACRQQDISILETTNYGKADFIICIPDDMSYSY